MNRYALPILLNSIIAIIPLAGYKLGIESLPDTLNTHQTKRIGLVTNQTGITSAGKRTVDVLRSNGFNVTTICVPEHGLDGTVPAGQSVSNSVDQKTNLPVISLYQGDDKTQPIADEILATIDTIFFDVQDSGMRHYTYISTLYKLLETCAQKQKSLIVFDRPNPLGFVMEGPLVEESLRSFVSIAPIPLRHGMTIGELAHYFNKHLLQTPAELTVIPMKGYRRTDQLNALQTFLSPNIRNIAACRGYSFLGLLGEVEPINTGGIINKPFQYLLLPASVHVRNNGWRTLQLQLSRDGIESKRVTINAKPEIFIGLSITIAHVNRCSSFNALLDVLDLFNHEKVPLSFKPMFDKCVGTQKVRLWIEQNGKRSELAQEINKEVETFYKQAQDCFLYNPLPHCRKVRDN